MTSSSTSTASCFHAVVLNLHVEMMVLNVEQPLYQIELQFRLENHAEDIKLSTLNRVTRALGKRLEVSLKLVPIFPKEKSAPWATITYCS